MNATFKHAMIAGAVALAMGSAGACLADDTTNSKTTPNTPTATTSTDTSSSHMTGKQKATAIGAGSGAAVGAVVGGPVGAVVGAGVGAVVGHQGTDANGNVTDSHNHWSKGGDEQVRKAQAALNDKGFNVAVDGRMGPNTEGAVRSFQEKNGLVASGTLDDATLNALGVKS
ncbi:MAG TPA: peptidoglycan-binding domain-containing protein [Casimicrobiaceae bacterium]|jgi:hypothetical protein|nr:peptidoglycan-binding domain-containing protein [Casimicrobiaceae bacterium]